jgi:hypothetical protein
MRRKTVFCIDAIFTVLAVMHFRRLNDLIVLKREQIFIPILALVFVLILLVQVLFIRRYS